MARSIVRSLVSIFGIRGLKGITIKNVQNFNILASLWVADCSIQFD